jgi:tetratricopeptide (TPR) repeat protein
VLEKKLGEARQRNSRLIWQVVIGFFIVIVVCILILVSLPYFKFVTPKDTPVTVSKIKEISESDTEKIREEFKELFQQYKGELEPRLQAANLEHWNQNALFEVNELDENMMLSFSNGDYLNALNNIKSLTTKTLAILDESEQIFKDNIEKATLFFSDDHYDKAKLHIEKALVVAPQSTEALALQQDIEKLQHILPLLNKANAARAEHDLLNEHNLLEQVLKINSNRPEETERFNLLKQMIRNNSFDAHISSGFSEIENHKIKEARYHYQRAKKIDPKRKELKVLLSQVLAEEKSYRIQQVIRHAEQEIHRDNWQQAKADFAKVIKDMPENEIAIKGLKRANEILGFQSVLGQYIKSPYRLTDSGVLTAAKKILVQAKFSSKYSSGLKKQIEQLDNLIATFNRLIPVKVMSDNMTDVRVRGIGKLGVILHKTIQLKPGNYTFEGTRKGFKSKLLQVLIPYDQNNYSVSIICDESI